MAGRNGKLDRGAAVTPPEAPGGARLVRRRYEVAGPGVVYMVVTVLVGLGAFNSQNNLLFLAFGVSLSLLGVSGVISGAMLMGLRVERTASGEAEAGGALEVEYRVTNRNRWVAAFGITIIELPATSAGKRGRRAREVPRVRDWGQRLEGPLGYIAHVPAGASRHVRAVGAAIARGEVELGMIKLTTGFPFGVIRKSVLFEQARRVVIRPKRADVGRAAASLWMPGEEGAENPNAVGRSEEFHSLREYQARDGVRQIAWRASARMGEMLVRQGTLRLPARTTVSLALSPGHSEDQWEAAISTAAGLVVSAHEHGLEVGLEIDGAGVSMRPGRGGAHVGLMLDELGKVDAAATAREGSRLYDGLDERGHRASPGRDRRGRVVVVKDGGVVERLGREEPAGAAVEHGGSAR